MKNLILVKHSLPEIDPSLPAEKWQLSDEGKRRCQNLAIQLAAYLPAMIFSSHEAKAIQTAQLIGGDLKIPAITRSGLEEHHRQNVGYLSEAEFHKNVAEFFSHPQELCFGEETADQTKARFSAAIDHILSNHSECLSFDRNAIKILLVRFGRHILPPLF